MEFNNCNLENNTFIEKAVITNEGIREISEPHIETVVAEEVKTSEKPSKNTTKKVSQPQAQIVKTTFLYRYVDSHPERIAHLYQALLRAKWIGEETEIEQFYSFFTGEDSDAKLRWTGTQAFLRYLFKVMLDREYITYPDGVPQQPWVIVQSHFVDRNRRLFSAWNKQKDPKRHRLTLETVASLLGGNGFDDEDDDEEYGDF